MDFLEIIEQKKLGNELTEEQITFFAQAAADPSSKDYQLAALLMAIRLNGMTDRETAQLTLAMAQTGDMLTAEVGGFPVDKHSTGGVGDTTTLVLAPLVAACGGKVIKMSGRGLGHTGGTIDKMESIPGMQVELPEEQFLEIVRKVGCCVVGQSAHLVPADKRLYSLRDVTSTVDSIPLIASSVMSKKLAGGAKGIVLDVKVGSGALMKTTEQCLMLSRAMVDIGTRCDREVVAFITGMEEPLGSHIGNALEVKEAIDVLAGRTKGPLLSVSLVLGEQMLIASGIAKDETAANKLLTKALHSGEGLQKLREMIHAQGGDARVCDDTALLPQASMEKTIRAAQGGYVSAIHAEKIGNIAQALGAGRRSKEDIIDPAVGIVLHRRIGDAVAQGEALATLYYNDPNKAKKAEKNLIDAFDFSPVPVSHSKLLYAKVTKEMTEVFS